ncbi:hypothetical protein C2G38_2206187, partial [Gigaspora rosea]
FLDNGQYLVLCARKEQTELLFQTLYVEIDMAFKRIHGCIIADEHQGQALGLGKYLHSKYCHLLSEEHLKHIYKLCQIHFNRNIRNKAISNETKELIYLIIKLNIQEEILHVLEKIKNYNKSGATEWVCDKCKPWILAGLSLAFIKIDTDIWNQTPNNTNVSESAHANINQDGRSLSLLAAIYRGDDFDQWQWHSAKTYEKSISQKKRKNKALDKNTEDLFSIPTSTSTIIPTMQEQDNYIEWENKKLELRQKSLEILKEEIALREKFNSLKQLSN